MSLVLCLHISLSNIILLEIHGRIMLVGTIYHAACKSPTNAALLGMVDTMATWLNLTASCTQNDKSASVESFP
jgi:hypothetical protein